jgi:hypothetical protein
MALLSLRSLALCSIVALSGCAAEPASSDEPVAAAVTKSRLEVLRSTAERFTVKGDTLYRVAADGRVFAGPAGDARADRDIMVASGDVTQLLASGSKLVARMASGQALRVDIEGRGAPETLAVPVSRDQGAIVFELLDGGSAIVALADVFKESGEVERSVFRLAHDATAGQFVVPTLAGKPLTLEALAVHGDVLTGADANGALYTLDGSGVATPSASVALVDDAREVFAAARLANTTYLLATGLGGCEPDGPKARTQLWASDAGGTRALVDLPADGVGLVAAENALYFRSGCDGSLYRVPREGGASKQVSPPIAPVGDEIVPWQAQYPAVTVGNYVYFANQSGIVRLRD